MTLPTLWTIAYWIWVASEILIALITRTKRGEGVIRDRGSLRILWFVIVLSVTACEFVRRLLPPNLPIAARWLLPLSLLILISGLSIRWAAIFTLGKSFSANVAIHESQTIHRTGVYGFLRHPSYLGLLLVFLAIGLRSQNWLGLLIVVLPTTAALLYRIRVEESALTETFGEEYAAYSRVTKRLIPYVY